MLRNNMERDPLVGAVQASYSLKASTGQSFILRVTGEEEFRTMLLLPRLFRQLRWYKCHSFYRIGSADLAKLNLDRRSYSVEGVTFIPTELAKQSRQQKHGTEFFFPCYPEDERLCPVLALREYEARTAPTRGSHSMLCTATSLLLLKRVRDLAADKRFTNLKQLTLHAFLNQ